MAARILVCGGRNYGIPTERTLLALNRATREEYHLHQVLSRIRLVVQIECIIEGEAKGADTFSRQWAEQNNIEVVKFPAAWKQHGKGAGSKRNQQMIDEGKPTHCVAFPGGNGTRDMINRCKNAGIPVLEVK